MWLIHCAETPRPSRVVQRHQEHQDPHNGSISFPNTPFCQLAEGDSQQSNTSSVWVILSFSDQLVSTTKSDGQVWWAGVLWYGEQTQALFAAHGTVIPSSNTESLQQNLKSCGGIWCWTASIFLHGQCCNAKIWKSNPTSPSPHVPHCFFSSMKVAHAALIFVHTQSNCPADSKSHSKWYDPSYFSSSHSQTVLFFFFFFFFSSSSKFSYGLESGSWS